MSAISPSMPQRKAYLNRDNQRLGLNIRRWILRRRAQWGILYREVAEQAGIHPTSLSRIVRGIGTSEETILTLAKVLSVPPGRFLVGLEHPERYPNVPPYRDRSTRTKRSGYSVPVRSIDVLLRSDTHLRSFVGGIDDPETLQKLRSALWRVREYARKKREQHIEHKEGPPASLDWYR